MSDRLAVGYQPNFDLDRAVGEQGELFVSSIAAALSAGTIEVKYEQAASKWGNVYIEYACRRQGEYRPSGIDATDADLWAWVLGRGEPQIAVVVPVALARAIKERAVREGSIRSAIKGSHPTNGAVVSLASLLRWLLAEADSSEQSP